MGRIVKLVLCFALFFTVSEPIRLIKTVVKIQNDIPGQTIMAHCYSKDDDIGYHELEHGLSIQFRFNPKLFGMTKFYCDFNTKEGAGNYAVYDAKIFFRCDAVCFWSIRNKGPCLQKTDMSFWCQTWKVSLPPSLLA